MKLIDYGFYNDSEAPTAVKVGGKWKTAPWKQAWTSMTNRAYCPRYHAHYPTYIGCSVANEWKSAESFRQWHMQHHVAGWQLDKDLLVPGNKIYSADTCMYVPTAVNTLLGSTASKRGTLPQGVSWDKRDGKYVANIRISSKRKNLGYFSDPRLAFIAYLTEKMPHARTVLDSYPAVGSRISDAVLREHFNLIAAEGLALLDAYASAKEKYNA